MKQALTFYRVAPSNSYYSGRCPDDATSGDTTKVAVYSQCKSRDQPDWLSLLGAFLTCQQLPQFDLGNSDILPLVTL